MCGGAQIPYFLCSPQRSRSLSQSLWPTIPVECKEVWRFVRPEFTKKTEDCKTAVTLALHTTNRPPFRRGGGEGFLSRNLWLHLITFVEAA